MNQIFESITQLNHSNSSDQIIHESWIRYLNQLPNWIVSIPMNKSFMNQLPRSLGHSLKWLIPIPVDKPFMNDQIFESMTQLNHSKFSEKIGH